MFPSSSILCVERGKAREASGGSHNCKKWILLTKTKHENNFLYLPLHGPTNEKKLKASEQ
jgi:hypothetical protein